MTGFARAAAEVKVAPDLSPDLSPDISPGLRPDLSFALEIKSVNHRFLDLHFRLPGGFAELEMQLRSLLKSRLRRGHVELSLHVDREATGVSLGLNQDLLAAYVGAFREASRLHGIPGDPDLNAILRLPGILQQTRGSEGRGKAAEQEALERAVLSAMPGLLDQLDKVRASEGAALVEQLRLSMRRIAAECEEVSGAQDDVRQGHFDRLRARLEQLLQGVQVSEQRLLAEAAVLAEKSDIEEENVRLRTHVDTFLQTLDEGGEVGKRLDFLLQEMNREANTTLAKTGGATGEAGLRITALGLRWKAEIERAREQVQNLE